jgi:hypothetical protein
MRRQSRNPSRPARSLESVLGQREGRPFCPKCKQFVKHKDAVWTARRQCRCPVCGELLERVTDTSVNGNGQA